MASGAVPDLRPPSHYEGSVGDAGSTGGVIRVGVVGLSYRKEGETTTLLYQRTDVKIEDPLEPTY